MPATLPMSDPAPARSPGSSWNPFATAPRSPSWERPASSHEPQDPPIAVIDEAILAALDALADAEVYGSDHDVEAAEERLARYQAVVVRHNTKEDDQCDEDLADPIDDWSDVVWFEDGEDEHGA